MLQFGVCCEAIHQNFDCGCVLKKGYANLQLSANPNEDKLQCRKFGISGLKSSLRATEKYGLPSRYGLPKLNATYHFT